MLTSQVVLCVARHSHFAVVRPVCPRCPLMHSTAKLGTKILQAHP